MGPDLGNVKVLADTLDRWAPEIGAAS